MKVGDTVMFVDEGGYKEWFYGKIGEVVNSRVNSAGKQYINVSWHSPVKYFGKNTSYSSFRASWFKLMSEADEAS
ncbi:MAG: hypothetical protein CMQ51_06955 [Gammaproteobacteria bacterium]|nr:hypothetical protein [Gammaproteobacteria bacterium]|tara:strand:- start:1188 stop:1412 length:225 start_codon:yes stop_codon:yes gene_type:complete